MAIEAVWDKLKKQKAKSDALPKRDPGGFVSQSLRKPGESFMDFTKRRHEVLYPGAQQMARQAGVGGFRAFGPAHQAYQNQLRARMGKAPGARYNSQDWQRMMAGLNPTTYPAGAAQVGGAPPGRPPLPTSMGNVLGGGQRPAIAPLQRKTAYMADPRNQATAAIRQIRHPGGDASLAEARTNMLRHDFSPVNVPLGQHYSGPRRSPLLDRPQAGPPGQFEQQQFSMADLENMRRQSIVARSPTPVQVPMGGGRRPAYNVLGGSPAGRRRQRLPMIPGLLPRPF